MRGSDLGTEIGIDLKKRQQLVDCVILLIAVIVEGPIHVCVIEPCLHFAQKNTEGDSSSVKRGWNQARKTWIPYRK